MNPAVPQVSVILPTYNAAQYLDASVGSVLRQSTGNFELLVLDNASTDDTPAVISRYSDPRLRYQRHEKNLGFVGNVSLGLGQARGRYVAFMGADDIWEHEFLQTTVDRLEANPQLSFVHAAAVFIDPNGDEFGAGGAGQWTPTMRGTDAFVEVHRSGFQFPAMLARTDLARRTGFETNWGDFSDLSLFLRLCLLGDVGFIERPLLRYRVHPDALSLRHLRDGAYSRNWIRAARDSFDWPDAIAAGLVSRRGEALSHIVNESLRSLHLIREKGTRSKLLNCFAENVRVAPSVMLRPATWVRLAFGLMPRGAIVGLQQWKRRRWHTVLDGGVAAMT